MAKLYMVFVHAWEYVNMRTCTTKRGKITKLVPDCGGGGFNWYPTFTEAATAYSGHVASLKAQKQNPDEWADFYFVVKTKHNPSTKSQTTKDRITKEIDSNLHDFAARASTRRVGKQVARYWHNRKFRMGGTKRPAPE